jgi:hypothetical protein
MTMSVPPPPAPRELGDPIERAPEASLFARIEDLINEEHALLLIPATERGRRDHERLHEIEDQLDRIWETLRERSRRLGQHTAGTTGGGSRTSSSARASSSETGSG